MSRQCEICGKKPMAGHNVSHSNRKTKRRWLPNLQTLKVNMNGTIRYAKICSRCIKGNKVKKA